MQFENDNHDFGNVPEGTMATHEFKFKNTGNQPMVIANVQASCGCTTPDWTKTPVLPGKSGIIKAMYSSAGRPGVFNKTVTVTSNATEPSKVLSIKGAVLTKDEMKPTLTPAQLAQSPHLVLDRSTHDFGKMEAGQQPTARFTVQQHRQNRAGAGRPLVGLLLRGLQDAARAHRPRPERRGGAALQPAPARPGDATSSPSPPTT